MKNDIAISVRGVSKTYSIAHNEERHTRLAEKLMARLRNPLHRPEIESFDALKDVSFDIKKGDVVGIIGRNGAGKSTLLKILSRITEPTTGEVKLYGRIASLLEVGTGFHPELTGRENIFLNGAILGMSRGEIRKQFDEIVDFSEIEKFLDTPVKRYSSGMYVRLAFAVAAHLNPEILIVDEVLAVGDAQFQKKCLGKMKEVSQGQGRTVLFVSHNIAAIQQLTKHAIYLKSGRVAGNDETDKVLPLYLNANQGDSMVIAELANSPRRYKGESGYMKITQLRFSGKDTNIFEHDEEILLEVTARAELDIPRFRISLTVFRHDESPVGSVFGPNTLSIFGSESKAFQLRLADLRLAEGSYFLGVAVGTGNDYEGFRDFDIVLDTMAFSVLAPATEDGTKSSWSPVWGPIRFPTPTVIVVPATLATPVQETHRPQSAGLST